MAKLMMARKAGRGSGNLAAAMSFVDMRALLDAMATDGGRFVLDWDTGEVMTAGDPSDDGRYLPVPSRDQAALEALVEPFLAELGSIELGAAEARQRLLAHPRLRLRFRAAEREALLEQALAWLRTSGVEQPTYELPPLHEGGRPRGPVGLIELLVLSATVGGEGPLRKRFRAASAAAARRAFDRTAEELGRLYGVPVDLDEIERRGWCQVEGARLSVHEDVVELTVSLPAGLRRAASEDFEP
jgi:hypothetical protein